MSLWHHPRAMVWLSNLLFAIALLLFAASALQWVVGRNQFAIWQVEVTAAQRLPTHPSALQRVGEASLRQVNVKSLHGSFFTADLQTVRAEFAKLPWVRQVDVRRIWPNRLLVGLEEHQVLGTWGEGRLLNTYGEVFVANMAEAESDGQLPEFSGPVGSELAVAQRWRELGQWLEPLHVKPVGLNLSARYAWSAQLENGSTLLLGRDGSGDHKERVARMVEAMPQVSAKLGEKPALIDLRYPNGFAVRAPAQLAAWEQEQQRMKANAAAAKSAASVAKPLPKPNEPALRVKQKNGSGSGTREDGRG
jgi:cell division protein FtsQ